MQRSLKLVYRKSFQILSLVAAHVACSALPGFRQQWEGILYVHYLQDLM